MEALSCVPSSIRLTRTHDKRDHIIRKSWGKGYPHPMPSVWPALLPCQEEEMRRLRVRSNDHAPQILVAEQEDQPSPHCLNRPRRRNQRKFLASETRQKWTSSDATDAAAK